MWCRKSAIQRQRDSRPLTQLEIYVYATCQPVIHWLQWRFSCYKKFEQEKCETNFNRKDTKIKHFVFPNRSACCLHHYLTLHVCHDAKSPKFPVENSCFERHPRLSRKAYGPATQVAPSRGRWSWRAGRGSCRRGDGGGVCTAQPAILDPGNTTGLDN